MAPLFSVIIPTYNGERYVRSALDSVLCQSLGDLEVIVTDDGSSDDTLRIVRSFGDPRIRVDEHARLGIGPNWNRGLALARGRYVKLMGQDDLLEPDCLTITAKTMGEHRGESFFFARRHVLTCDDDGLAWAAKFGTLEDELLVQPGWNDGKALLRRWHQVSLGKNLIGEPVSVAFTRGLATQLGGFSKRLAQTLDFAMWARMLARAPVAYSPRHLSTFRFHPENASNRVPRQRFERAHLYRELALDPRVRAIIPRLPREALRMNALAATLPLHPVLLRTRARLRELTDTVNSGR